MASSGVRTPPVKFPERMFRHQEGKSTKRFSKSNLNKILFFEKNLVVRDFFEFKLQNWFLKKVRIRRRSFFLERLWRTRPIFFEKTNKCSPIVPNFADWCFEDNCDKRWPLYSGSLVFSGAFNLILIWLFQDTNSKITELIQKLQCFYFESMFHYY